MRQILQSLKSGETLVVEIPSPRVRAGHVLISTRASVISAGTERMLLNFGRAGWISKARQQPEKVKQVLAKVRTDGLWATFDAVQAKLDRPLPLGYCNAGVVLEIGSGVTGLAPGDLVISNGPHAEVVCVPEHLCAKVPAGVSAERAAFTVLGAIALQGIRLAAPTLGETFVVSGLGLLGLLAVQLLRANGCRVIGVDLDEERIALARRLGAVAGVDLARGEDPIATARGLCPEGVDGVLLAVSSSSDEPVSQAARLCRKRGRIVLVGVTGLHLQRADFYEKELSFQVSCSYGPGRYDADYEQKGVDYPLPYVRWTEQRNFGAVLDLLAQGSLDVEPLISHRFPIERGHEAYEVIGSAEIRSLAVVLTYSGVEATVATSRAEATAVSASRAGQPCTPVLGIVGAGNFGGQVLVPALARTGARLKTIASASGVSGTHLARKHGIEHSVTDLEAVFEDPEINTVVLTTRHDDHARLVVRALQAGKHVFVEKPLALSAAQLAEVVAAHEAAGDGGAPLVMVGFNRRFAPLTRRLHELLRDATAPQALVMTVNAGYIPADSWVQDAEVGGGRIVGEACHFIDLLRYLAGAPIVEHSTVALGAADGVPRDSLTLTLRFANGSVGTVHYLANGHKSFPKERLEIFVGGRIARIDNFRSLELFGWPTSWKSLLPSLALGRQDKGHSDEVAAFIDAIRRGSASPIPFTDLVEVTRTSLEVAARAEV